MPQAAATAWLASADHHRDVLACSDAIARAIAAHDDAARGCEARLRAGLAPIVEPLARGGRRRCPQSEGTLRPLAQRALVQGATTTMTATTR
jgi:hypothetical protein